MSESNRYVLSQVQLDNIIQLARKEERERLLALPSMQDEPDIAPELGYRNELRATLRAEVSAPNDIEKE